MEAFVCLHSESPLAEGLLFAGTDDGLIQVLDPTGMEWRKVDEFGDVPEMMSLNTARRSAGNARRVGTR